jgi:tyrosyl-tRNA synthetase
VAKRRAGVLDELTWRGQLAQSTDPDALTSALRAGRITLYAGFDPTADSLHVGNLVPVMLLHRFQRAGHRPLALVGGATGLIGDPSGRSSERELAAPELIAERVERQAKQLQRFLDFGPGGAELVNNLDWTRGLSVLDFLRDVGKHFSVGAMLGKESVSARIGAGGISFTEFSYMLLQAMDFLELSRRYDCTLQVGGSDQWGNITAGLDLMRKVDGSTGHALTAPLLTDSEGRKIGKSTGGGNVWLDPDRTSPYAFYQYFINVADTDVGKLLRTFTDLERAEIEGLDTEVAERPAARTAQRRLAEEMTTLVHGADECAKVIAASAALFGRGALEDLDERTLSAALQEAPHVRVADDGALPTVAELLADTGLSPSRSAARRTIKEGGAYVNNGRVTDEDAAPTGQDFLHGRYLVLRRGRRDVAVVERRA